MPHSEQDDSSISSTSRNRSVDAADLLASTGASPTTSSEFYSPIPDGYRRGRHKYVAVLGTVMSGLGKGIFSSSLAKLLKDKGLVVAPIKLEGYLNIDSGTLNPFRHGEVFVLDDGTECDMDLGTYERLLDQNLSRKNFTTSGQIYSEVLQRERHGDYLGRDVQMIPHVTGEVKRKLRQLAMHGDGKNPADVVFIEVGGTVGDYENIFYIEALRELAFEEGPGSCCFVGLTYIIEPAALGEQKSKAAQLGIRRLMETGVQPSIIACRSQKECTATVLEKIAMFSNVPPSRVFSMHDRKSIYTIPDAMRSDGLDREVLSLLDLHGRVKLTSEDAARAKWSSFSRRLTSKKSRRVTIGLTGKYSSVRDAYASIDKAAEHCSAHLDVAVDLKWIDTTAITDRNVATQLGGLDAVIVPGGFGTRGVEGKIAAAKYCRETKLPYLGICLGFQVAVIEFARNVLGLTKANSTEFEPGCAEPVISELPDQKKIEQLGGTMRLGGQDVLINPGTLADRLYSASLELFEGDRTGARGRGRGDQSSPLLVRQRFRHRYEVDPDYIDRLESARLTFSGRHPDHPIMQILELAQTDGDTGQPVHPYFVAAQFHPELTGRPLRPQPLFMGLVAAAIRQQHADVDLGPWAGPVVSTKTKSTRNGSAHPQTC